MRDTRSPPARRLLARLRRSEEGAVTIPTLFWLPLYIMIMVSAVEMGVVIFKQTLLDRGVDLTTRIMRLGIEPMPSHEELKRSICTNIGFIHNCMERLAVEVFPVDTDTWVASNQSAAMCTDSSSAAEISPQIERGGSNQLMILRACLKIETMTEVDPLAQALVRDNAGHAALISITSFVNEPRNGS